MSMKDDCCPCLLAFGLSQQEHFSQLSEVDEYRSLDPN